MSFESPTLIDLSSVLESKIANKLSSIPVKHRSLIKKHSSSPNKKTW